MKPMYIRKFKLKHGYRQSQKHYKPEIILIYESIEMKKSQENRLLV